MTVRVFLTIRVFLWFRRALCRADCRGRIQPADYTVSANPTDFRRHRFAGTRRRVTAPVSEPQSGFAGWASACRIKGSWREWLEWWRWRMCQICRGGGIGGLKPTLQSVLQSLAPALKPALCTSSLCIRPVQSLANYLTNCLTSRRALQNGKTASDGIRGVFVRNLAVGAVVGFELSGDELELLEENMALRADALRTQAVKLSAQAV